MEYFSLFLLDNNRGEEEKSGFKLEDVIQGELNKDLELRVWYDEEIIKIDNKIT